MRLFFVSYLVRLRWQPDLHDTIFMSNTWQYCSIENRRRRQHVEYFML